MTRTQLYLFWATCFVGGISIGIWLGMAVKSVIAWMATLVVLAVGG